MSAPPPQRLGGGKFGIMLITMNCGLDKTVVPWTWSPCIKTRDRIVVNPEDIGAGGIPVLGVNKARNMSAGAELHRHTCMEITVCEHGAVKFDADGRAWALLPGTVFVTQPGSVHRLRSNVRGSVLRWIFVALPKDGETFLGLSKADSAIMASRLKSLTEKLYLIPATDMYLIGELFKDYNRTDSPADMRLVRFRTDAIRFLLSVIDSRPLQDELLPKSRIKSILLQMRRAPEKDYPIEELISETQMSETSLASAFKRETGQTPHEFLVTCRIRKAMDILSKDSSARITDLAITLGFASSQHFAARFRRETGKTPSEWRAHK